MRRFGLDVSRVVVDNCDEEDFIKMIMDVEALLEESSRREIGRPQVAPPSWSGQQNYDIIYYDKFELFFETN